jgi:hypothetical protein
MQRVYQLALIIHVFSAIALVGSMFFNVATIGWDAVEEGEVGVKSTMSPAGGELSGSWLRAFVTALVDPTGFYFLRDQLPLPG